MIPLLKAEWRKLTTVRSTYVVLILALLFTALIGGYAFGYRSADALLQDMSFASNSVLEMLGFVASVGAVVPILQVAHEYRYNTITYSLVTSNSRTKVWLAKLAALSVFSLVFTIAVMAVGYLAVFVGCHVAGGSFGVQQIYVLDVLWRAALFTWAYFMFGALLAGIFRNVVGAALVIFLAPGTIEPLLGFLLKRSADYLPFAALHRIVVSGVSGGSNLSLTKASLVTLAYVVVLGLINWQLLLRRDAN